MLHIEAPEQREAGTSQQEAILVAEHITEEGQQGRDFVFDET